MSVNEQLAEELHKPVIKRNVYASFKENIWEANLAEMRSFSSKNKNVKYLLCVIYVFTKYACVELLKIKRVRQLLIFLSK